MAGWVDSRLLVLPERPAGGPRAASMLEDLVLTLLTKALGPYVARAVPRMPYAAPRPPR